MTTTQSAPLLFDRNRLIRMIIPLLIENFLTTFVSFLSSIMVAHAGEAVVSAISLVNQIFMIMNLMFMALASGGSVVSAQYLGKGIKEEACKAANQLMLACFSVSVFVMFFALITNKHLLRLVFGDVSDDVMNNATVYFGFIAFSAPFLALYNSSASLFRAMGNTKTTMIVAFIMNGVNLLGNAFFIRVFDMGIVGVALATILSRIFAATVMLIFIRNPKLPLHVSNFFKDGFDFSVIRKILKIGVPSALENGIFHFGKLLTLRLIATFGTASIAANSCASNIDSMSHTAASSIGICLITVVGQCVGAEQYDQAKMYAKRFLKYSYIFVWMFGSLAFILASQIAGLYDLTSEATEKTIILIRINAVACMTVWPPAWTTPNALRAAGDAKYTMYVSIISMWVCRVAMAYVFSSYMEAHYGLGVVGVTMALVLDWTVRAICFSTRLFRGKWQNKSLVRD